MMLHRLGELRKEIKAQPIEAADQQEFQEAHHVVEADRDVADGVEAEETAVFRDNVKVGDQVAILVARDAAGVPFLIGDVIEIVQGPGPLKIQWFSPAVKKSGVTGKWTPDCLPGGVEPSVECDNRDNVIPVQAVWTLKGFTRKAWWQAHEAVRDSDRGVDRHMGSPGMGCRRARRTRPQRS